MDNLRSKGRFLPREFVKKVEELILSDEVKTISCQEAINLLKTIIGCFFEVNGLRCLTDSGKFGKINCNDVFSILDTIRSESAGTMKDIVLALIPHVDQKWDADGLRSLGRYAKGENGGYMMISILEKMNQDNLIAPLTVDEIDEILSIPNKESMKTYRCLIEPILRKVQMAEKKMCVVRHGDVRMKLPDVEEFESHGSGSLILEPAGRIIRRSGPGYASMQVSGHFEGSVNLVNVAR
jgi:hypothetical protein